MLFAVRTIKQSNVVNPTTGVHEYSNTPSNLWPVHINTSAPGTIQWSSCIIDWQDLDSVLAGKLTVLKPSSSCLAESPQIFFFLSVGHFYAHVQSITTVKCADAVSRREIHLLGLHLEFDI
ncbi:hypothetical protein EV361DRAFT_811090 [Lentinula raphanica]|nr:hypothetical protein EV361DRAFT_811090 [Lentinula raphanica]